MLPQTPQTAQEPNPESGAGGDIGPMLVKIIQKAMQAAQANGLSFDQLVAEAKQGGSDPTNAQMPPPPSSMPMPA